MNIIIDEYFNLDLIEVEKAEVEPLVKLYLGIVPGLMKSIEKGNAAFCGKWEIGRNADLKGRPYLTCKGWGFTVELLESGEYCLKFDNLTRPMSITKDVAFIASIVNSYMRDK